MEISEIDFERQLKAALIKAAEIDYMSKIPPDDEIIVSPTLKRKMHRLLRNPSGYIRNRRRPIFMRVLRTAAMVAISLTIAFGALMSVPRVRAVVVEFVRSWFSTHTEYRIVGLPNTEIGAWKIGYLPNGYEFAADYSNELHIMIEFESAIGEQMFIEIVGGNGSPHVDNEHSDFYEIELNGNRADIYESNAGDYPSYVLVLDEKHDVIINVTGSVDIAELIKIAESIVPQ